MVLLLFFSLSLQAQTWLQGAPDSGDDNPPGLEEAWKNNYSSRGSFRSPYGNLENEIPESYGNSPSRVSSAGKSYATKCRPKKYRETFELPPEAFSEYCEARTGKSFKKRSNSEKMLNYHQQMLPRYYGNGVPMGNRISGKDHSKKYVITTAQDLYGVEKALREGKEIHDHRHGKKGCQKCHGKTVKKRVHQKTAGKNPLKNYNPFKLKTTSGIAEKKVYPGNPYQHLFNTRRANQPAAKKPVMKRRPAGKTYGFKNPKRKPDFGYSYTHSKGSSVLINYSPRGDGNGRYEWGTQNRPSSQR